MYVSYLSEYMLQVPPTPNLRMHGKRSDLKYEVCSEAPIDPVFACIVLAKSQGIMKLDRNSGTVRAADDTNLWVARNILAQTNMNVAIR